MSDEHKPAEWAGKLGRRKTQGNFIPANDLPDTKETNN